MTVHKVWTRAVLAGALLLSGCGSPALRDPLQFERTPLWTSTDSHLDSVTSVAIRPGAVIVEGYADTGGSRFLVLDADSGRTRWSLDE